MEQVTNNLRVSGTVEDGLARLRVAGDVDLATAQIVRQAIGEALDEGAREVELDLAEVGFLDSTGLSVLLHAARDVDRRRASLRTFAPNGSEARVVMDLARVADLLALQAG